MAKWTDLSKREVTSKEMKRFVEKYYKLSTPPVEERQTWQQHMKQFDAEWGARRSKAI